MHGYFGNVDRQEGYACMAKALVAEWRSLWSIEPGTTDPMAPFGLVTLAPSGTEVSEPTHVATSLEVNSFISSFLSSMPSLATLGAVYRS